MTITCRMACDRIDVMRDAVADAKHELPFDSWEYRKLDGLWHLLHGTWYGLSIAGNHGIEHDDFSILLETVSGWYVDAMCSATPVLV